jgi:hypothetical protein
VQGGLQVCPSAETKVPRILPEETTAAVGNLMAHPQACSHWHMPTTFCLAHLASILEPAPLFTRALASPLGPSRVILPTVELFGADKTMTLPNGGRRQRFRIEPDTVSPPSRSSQTSPSRQHEEVGNIRNPLAGPQGAITFTLLLLLAVSTTLICCSNEISISGYSLRIATGLVFILSLGLLAFSVALRPKEFWLFLISYSLIAAPFCYFFLSNNPSSLVLALAIGTAFITLSSIPYREAAAGDLLLLIPFIAWSALSALYQIAKALGTIDGQYLGDHKLLDYIAYSRRLLSICFALILLIRSIRRVASQRPPSVSDPLHAATRLGSRASLPFFKALIEPLLVISSIALRVSVFIINAVWRIATYAIAYLYRFATELAQSIWNILSESQIWKNFAKGTITIILAALFGRFLKPASLSLITYLRLDNGITADFLPLLFLGLDFLFLDLGIYFICWLWLTKYGFFHSSHRCSFGISMSLMSFGVAGSILQLSSRFIHLPGLIHVGPYTALFLVSFVSIFLWQLTRMITTQSR